jgi:hypothetical protein
LKHKEAPIVDNTVVLSDEEYRERKRLENLVALPKEVKKIQESFQKMNNLIIFLENSRPNQRSS